MERAAKSLAKLKLSDTVTHQDLAFAAWTPSVGKRLAKYAWPKALVRGNLIVEVGDAIWQKQLFHLRSQILKSLNDTLGDGIVSGVEFRIATPRRPPQTAQSLGATVSSDEADRIEDSVFRHLYKQARKKASA